MVQPSQSPIFMNGIGLMNSCSQIVSERNICLTYTAWAMLEIMLLSHSELSHFAYVPSALLTRHNLVRIYHLYIKGRRPLNGSGVMCHKLDRREREDLERSLSGLIAYEKSRK